MIALLLNWFYFTQRIDRQTARQTNVLYSTTTKGMRCCVTFTRNTLRSRTCTHGVTIYINSVAQIERDEYACKQKKRKIETITHRNHFNLRISARYAVYFFSSVFLSLHVSDHFRCVSSVVSVSVIATYSTIASCFVLLVFIPMHTFYIAF